MKTPDKIKKGLECCSTHTPECHMCPYNIKYRIGCSGIVAADALAYIQQLEAAQPKWISVKERLPERAMKCIVRSKAGRTFTTWYDPEVYRFVPHFAKSNITHWMHLPKAPKEDE